VLSIRETIPVARLGDAMGERIRVLARFLRVVQLVQPID